MKRKDQILLPHGCWCSRLFVFPENWETGDESLLKQPWYISYRFYDPNRIDSLGKVVPKQKILKGMNDIYDLDKRKQVTKNILYDELYMLTQQGYNPITGNFVEPIDVDIELSEYTPLDKAFKSALKTADLAEKTRKDIANTVKHIYNAAISAKVAKMPISEVRLKHVRAILNFGPKTKKNWSNNQFNVWKKYMGILFRELKENGVIDHNPANEINNRKIVKSEREEIDMEMRRRIDAHLREKKMTRFRLFLRIFFSSGAREKELLRVQIKDVNIKSQFFWVTIHKGDQYKRVRKTIPNDSIRYWKLAIYKGNQNDYVFGRYLKPSPKSIREEQLNRRWRTQVKNYLGIERNLYEMKHSRTTAVSDHYSQEHAAAANSHTSLKLIHSVYDLKHQMRRHEELKKVNVSFL